MLIGARTAAWGLPYDEEVKYLWSSGTQFINLPFGFDDTDEVSTRLAFPTYAADSYMNSPIMWNTNRNRFGFGIHKFDYYTSNHTFTIAFGNSPTGLTSIGSYDEEFHNWDYKQRVATVSGVGTKDLSSVDWGGTTANLRLFYGYVSNTACKVANYYHKKSGVYMAALIPVLKDGVAQFYDVEKKEFLTNDGTGTFGYEKMDGTIVAPT